MGLVAQSAGLVVQSPGMAAQSAGMAAQSVMSATAGHWDVHGLSATDPRLRQWSSVCTIPKDVGMPL